MSLCGCSNTNPIIPTDPYAQNCSAAEVQAAMAADLNASCDANLRNLPIRTSGRIVITDDPAAYPGNTDTALGTCRRYLYGCGFVVQKGTSVKVTTSPDVPLQLANPIMRDIVSGAVLYDPLGKALWDSPPSVTDIVVQNEQVDPSTGQASIFMFRLRGPQGQGVSALCWDRTTKRWYIGSPYDAGITTKGELSASDTLQLVGFESIDNCCVPGDKSMIQRNLKALNAGTKGNQYYLESLGNNTFKLIPVPEADAAAAESAHLWFVSARTEFAAAIKLNFNGTESGAYTLSNVPKDADGNALATHAIVWASAGYGTTPGIGTATATLIVNSTTIISGLTGEETTDSVECYVPLNGAEILNWSVNLANSDGVGNITYSFKLAGFAKMTTI